MRQDPPPEEFNEKGEMRVPVMGRPTYWTPERIDEEADALYEWMQDPENVYFLGFCAERGYSKQTFHRMVTASRRMKEVYDWVKGVQEQRIASGALKNQYNAYFAKFMMGNVGTGWTDKSEVKNEISGSVAMDGLLTKLDGRTKSITDINNISDME